MERQINPITGKVFVRGDVMEGRPFKEYRDSKAIFFKNEVSYANHKLRLSRSLSNKNIYGKIAKDLLHDCKKRAKKNGGFVDINFKDLVDILKDGYCQGSYPPLRFVLDKPGSPFSPSLDRINSENKNYTLSNVRVVCTGINLARHNFCDEDCITICKGLLGFLSQSKVQSDK
jgi:hypothetical protein